MADSGMGTVVKIGLLGGAAWLAWNYFQSSVAAPVVAAPAAGTAPPAATAATALALVIPPGLTVTPDINASLKGTVGFNGAQVTINVIPGNAGNTSGVIFSSAGADITGQFSPAQIQQLVAAFSTAPQTKGVSGFGGMGSMSRNYVPRGTPMLLPRNYVRRGY